MFTTKEYNDKDLLFYSFALTFQIHLKIFHKPIVTMVNLWIYLWRLNKVDLWL